MGLQSPEFVNVWDGARRYVDSFLGILGDHVMTRTHCLKIGALLLMVGAAGGAEARVNVDIGIGLPLFYPGPVYRPAYFYPAPVYYGPPVAPVIVQPQVVVQPPVPSQVVYQYYCAPSGAYYPAVPTCVEPWIKVAPDGSRAN